MRLLVLFALMVANVAGADGPGGWGSATNSHFKVYSESGAKSAERALAWFDQLRAFIAENGLLGPATNSATYPVLRVVRFNSEGEYNEYRNRPSADAFYVSDSGDDYIVMQESETFGVAAHEYAHFILHGNGLELPPCINEGLAEFFSTLRVTRSGGYELGGDLPARTQALRRTEWIPLSVLLDSSREGEITITRKGADIFYSESWALVDMLMSSPTYKANFRSLISALNAGQATASAFQSIYGVSLDKIGLDLRNWVGLARSSGINFEARQEGEPFQTAQLTPNEVSALLARISLVSGHYDDAATRYRKMAQSEPENPEFAAALGVIALRQGKREEAINDWRQALDHHVNDAALCYRYAILAEDEGKDSESIRKALERAVELDPGFDDARYKLALLENRLGDSQEAVRQLKAMRVPDGDRRFAYWSALSSGLTDLDQRQEAVDAAHQAIQAARTESEKSRARQLEYMAKTDLTVQYETDAEGHSQLVTTRVPHGTKNWNPFIEPTDRMQRTAGKLQEVLCTSGKLTGFRISTPSGPVTLDVPDPLHVMVRNSPDQLFCGPMPEPAVDVEYAINSAGGKTSNILRGLTFH